MLNGVQIRIGLCGLLLVAFSRAAAVENTVTALRRALVAEGYQQVRVVEQPERLWLEIAHVHRTGAGDILGRAVRMAHDYAADGVQDIRVRLLRGAQVDCFNFPRDLLQRYYRRMLPRAQLFRDAHMAPAACRRPQQATDYSGRAGRARYDVLPIDPLAGAVVLQTNRLRVDLYPLYLMPQVQSDDGRFYLDPVSAVQIHWQPFWSWQFGSRGFYRWRDPTVGSPALVDDLSVYAMDRRRQRHTAVLETAYGSWRWGDDTLGVALTAGVLDEFLVGGGLRALLPSGIDGVRFDLRADRIAARPLDGDFGLADYRQTSLLAGVFLGAKRWRGSLLAGRFVAGDEGVRAAAGYGFDNGIAMEAWLTVSDSTSTEPQSRGRDENWGISIRMPLGAIGGGTGQRDLPLVFHGDVNDRGRLVSRPADALLRVPVNRHNNDFDNFGQ